MICEIYFHFVTTCGEHLRAFQVENVDQSTAQTNNTLAIWTRCIDKSKFVACLFVFALPTIRCCDPRKLNAIHSLSPDSVFCVTFVGVVLRIVIFDLHFWCRCIQKYVCLYGRIQLIERHQQRLFFVPIFCVAINFFLRIKMLLFDSILVLFHVFSEWGFMNVTISNNWVSSFLW